MQKGFPPLNEFQMYRHFDKVVASIKIVSIQKKREEVHLEVWNDIKLLETRRGRDGGEHSEDHAKIWCSTIYQSHDIWFVNSIYFSSKSNVIPHHFNTPH